MKNDEHMENGESAGFGRIYALVIWHSYGKWSIYNWFTY